MNQFILFILDNLKYALIFAFFAIIVCSSVLFLSKKLFHKKYKGTKTFSTKKYLLFVIFIAYLAVLFYATLLRGAYSGGMNLHLFSGWREAWNNFSTKSWLNILLNIAIFVPLGIFLPFLSEKLAKPFSAFFVGLGTSLSIELIQYFTHRGTFDADDLFTNTLGNFIGYSLITCILTLKNRPPQMAKKLLGASIVPIISLAVIGGIFTTYQLKEYGNLPNAPTYRINTSDITWTLSTELSNTPMEVLISQAKQFDKKALDEFGYAFMERIGQADNMNVQYYEEETYFMNNSTGYFLIVSIYDGSYRFQNYSMDEIQTKETDEATIRELLSFYDISIPENAQFSSEEDGWHTFTIERTNTEQEIVGTLRCQYTTDNTLCEIQNNLVHYIPYKTETILSPMEAYEKVKNGDFASPYFEYYLPKEADIISCELEYQIDTKGFYQPVYRFEIAFDNADVNNIPIYVSAM